MRGLSDDQNMVRDAMALSIGKLWLCDNLDDADKVRLSKSTAAACKVAVDTIKNPGEASNNDPRRL
jgi:hypothetical protein